MKRRTAITALPLGVLGLAAAAKGKSTPASKGVLDERALSYSIYLITDASTSGINCSFVAFAQHIAALAKAGDCQTVHAVAERLTDALRRDSNRYYGETREQWIAEELGGFSEVVDMDDSRLSEEQQDLACQRFEQRHERRRAKGGAA